MKKILMNIAFTAAVLLLFFTGQAKVKAAEEDSVTYDIKIDVVKDLLIDSKDLATIAKGYNKTSKSTGWNKSIDINNDNIIDIYDLTIVSRAIGNKIEIDSLYDFAEVGQNYLLKSPMKLKLGDKDYINLPVKWNGSADTSAVGTYTYTGVVEGYNRSISFDLTVVPVNIDSALSHCGFLTFDGNYIYYSNRLKKDGFYKANIDGSNPYKLDDAPAISINYYDGWLYYINRNNRYIYKIKTDGTEKTLVDTGNYKYLKFYNGRLYCIEYNIYSLYSMNLDGTDKKIILDNMYPNSFSFVENYIYYNNSHNIEGDCIYRFNLEDNSITPINITGAKWINVSDKYIFYMNPKYLTLHREDIDGGNQLLLDDGYFVYIPHLLGDWVYYVSDGTTSLYSLRRVKFDMSIDENIIDMKIEAYVNIRAGRIYFYDSKDNLFSCKIDGTDIRPFQQTP